MIVKREYLKSTHGIGTDLCWPEDERLEAWDKAFGDRDEVSLVEFYEAAIAATVQTESLRPLEGADFVVWLMRDLEYIQIARFEFNDLEGALGEAEEEGVWLRATDPVLFDKVLDCAHELLEALKRLS